MKNERLASLMSFFEEEPHDPFNIYALALEYLKSDQREAARYFEKLLDEHPAYLPTYYHAGELFIQLEMLDKAGEIYQRGIALALNQNNQKTYQELLRAYLTYQDELED